jgi:hypothetical protein
MWTHLTSIWSKVKLSTLVPKLQLGNPIMSQALLGVRGYVAVDTISFNNTFQPAASSMANSQP